MNFIASKTAPPGAIEVVQQTLADWAEDIDPDKNGQGEAQNQFVSDIPLQVYALRLDDINKGGDLRAAVPICWRCLIMDQHHVLIGLADVCSENKGGPLRLGSHMKGMVVESSGLILEQASDDPELTGSFEPRYLEIPGIGITAIWLKSFDNIEEDASNDWLIPVAPVPGFVNLKKYQPEKFFQVIKPIVAGYFKLNNAPSITQQPIPSENISAPEVDIRLNRQTKKTQADAS